MIVFDVEIKKAILGRKDKPIDGIEYCEGWRDFAGMGISCVCTYDIVTHLTRVFLEDDLESFVEYVREKPTAGFNTVNFDIELINTELLKRYNFSLMFDTHYDILREIWIALGLNPDKFNPRTHGGWGLDAVCEATLGLRKTGHGALAPVWWQQGKHGKVIDYCCNDVHMEGSLLLHILHNDGLVTNGKEQVRVRVPDGELSRLVENTRVLGAQYGAAQKQAFEETSDPSDLSSPTKPPAGLGIIR